MSGESHDNVFQFPEGPPSEDEEELDADNDTLSEAEMIQNEHLIQKAVDDHPASRNTKNQ